MTRTFSLRLLSSALSAFIALTPSAEAARIVAATAKTAPVAGPAAVGSLLGISVAPWGMTSRLNAPSLPSSASPIPASIPSLDYSAPPAHFAYSTRFLLPASVVPAKASLPPGKTNTLQKAIQEAIGVSAKDGTDPDLALARQSARLTSFFDGNGRSESKERTASMPAADPGGNTSRASLSKARLAGDTAQDSHGVLPPRTSFLRSLPKRARVIARVAWWKIRFGYAVGIWREFRETMGTARGAAGPAAVRNPRALFIALSQFKWSRLADPLGPQEIEIDSVVREAREIFSKHFDAPPKARDAFDRYLRRAIDHNPRRNSRKLRKKILTALAELAPLGALEIPAALDVMLPESAGAAVRRFQSREMDEILIDFSATADRLVETLNRDILPDRQVLGAALTGSFVRGDAEPGSDLDILPLVMNGNAEQGRLFHEALVKEWAQTHPAIPISPFEFSLPPDRAMIGHAAGDAYRIISPYPEISKSLEYQNAKIAGSPPSELRRIGANLTRRLYHWALTAVLAAVDGLDGAPGLYPRPPPSPVETRAGYVPELDGLEPSQPHTFKKMRDYLVANLGRKTMQAIENDEKARFLVILGDSHKALAAATELGWRRIRPVSKSEGSHRIFLAENAQGRRAFLITRVNGDDRLIHIHSRLKLAGVPASRVLTVGKTFSWKNGYLDTFRRLGHVPDGVIYGFPNTTVGAILLRHKVRNAGRFLKLATAYVRKHRTHGAARHDLHSWPLQVLEFEGGKRLWTFSSLYGDLARDLIEALLEHGVDNIAFAGTAGSLNPDLRRGETVTPALLRRSDGKIEDLSWLERLPGTPRRGTYQRVSTPHLETVAWLEQKVREGVDITELELEYTVNAVQRYPGTRLRAMLVVSDVLRGPQHSDLTEWARTAPARLIPQIDALVDATLDFKKDSDSRLTGYRIVPLIEER